MSYTVFERMIVAKPEKSSDSTKIYFNQLLVYARSKGFGEEAALRLWRILLAGAMEPPHPHAGKTSEVIRTLWVPLDVIQHAATQPLNAYRTYGPKKRELLQGWVKTL